MALLETVKRAGRTIEVHTDEDPGNPRTEWDQTATFACWHRRYNLGDEQIKPCSADELRERVEGILYLAPLYLYDHSGITIRVGSGFADRFDSGQVGWAYLTSDALESFGWNVEDVDDDRMKAIVDGEVETYDRYLTGRVYGYVVKGRDGDVLDSLWGIFDDAREVETQAIAACDACEDPADQRLADEVAARATFAGPA